MSLHTGLQIWNKFLGAARGKGNKPFKRRNVANIPINRGGRRQMYTRAEAAMIMLENNGCSDEQL